MVIAGKNVNTEESNRRDRQQGCAELQGQLQAARQRLRILRLAGRVWLVIEVAILAACWHFVLIEGGRWASYVWSLGALLAWYHAVPWLLVRCDIWGLGDPP